MALAVFAISSVSAEDYLGNLSANPYNTNSTSNPYGAGSPYKANGIKNPYGTYGSPYSSKSVTNPYATDTPRLYDDEGNYRGKLSSNRYDSESVSNPYGRYGSQYSSESINNPYGPGSPYRKDSPINSYGHGMRIYGQDSASTPRVQSFDDDSSLSDWSSQPAWSERESDFSNDWDDGWGDDSD